ncbi:recombinase family protein [Streptomyces longisporoflavus]|uniref:Recombinase family protein n=1 Tax=Streptomyces longisporoflavus TaxID=28044 RepID=A0ABW7R5C3_9ACTN
MPRSYPPEFRRKVLDLVESGRKIAEVAELLGISDQTIYVWRRQHVIDTGQVPGTTNKESSELASARRRIAELEAELAIHRRAADLGWTPSRVLVIDDNLGHSASGLVDRPGFQRLVSEVGLDHVGLVLGVEMSRLARSGREWHQLLELCTLAGALLADRDGVYDPVEHNDRLLLGLKGAISKAELHLIKQRMETRTARPRWTPSHVPHMRPWRSSRRGPPRRTPRRLTLRSEQCHVPGEHLCPQRVPQTYA